MKEKYVNLEDYYERQTGVAGLFDLGTVSKSVAWVHSVYHVSRLLMKVCFSENASASRAEESAVVPVK